MHLLHPMGMFLLNAIKIPTVLNNMGLDEYPSAAEVMKASRKYCPKGHVIEVSALAKKLGNIQMTHVVMLGALVRLAPFFHREEISRLVPELSPKRFEAANLKAFEEGYKAVGN